MGRFVDFVGGEQSSSKIVPEVFELLENNGMPRVFLLVAMKVPTTVVVGGKTPVMVGSLVDFMVGSSSAASARMIHGVVVVVVVVVELPQLEVDG